MQPIIHASLGVLYRRLDSSVLLACRPPGKIMAGYWEFPGGKIEPGETPQQALIRELDEELGIIVAEADLKYLGQIEHIYTHGLAKLEVILVSAWKASVYPREGQQLAWVDLQQKIELAPLLPTTISVLQLVTQDLLRK